MSESFLSSDEYDENAHSLYNEGRYDEALDLLRVGVTLYPHAVELHVGMAYAYLAREEYAWARRSFDRAIARDPDHEDALAGLGETLLKIGDRGGALAAFERVVALGFREDHELMLQLGRALFREGLLAQAHRFFEFAVSAHPDSPEAAACVGYASHRLGNESGALYWLRRALEIDPTYAEARIYLANLLYDRGESEASLHHLERTQPEEHFDELALWRYIELKKSLFRLPDDDPELAPWLARLGEVAAEPDSIDMLLAEMEALLPDGSLRDPNQLELFGTLMRDIPGMSRRPPADGMIGAHVIETLGGLALRGSWDELLLQLQAVEGAWADGTITEFMQAYARRGAAETGVRIPITTAEAFLRGSAAAGVIRIVE